jgi:hypothetical protein
MNKLLLSLGTAMLSTFALNAQTTLFFEDFESAPAFNLNTSDQGGTTSGADNPWIVNNVYAGGSGTFSCLGFSFPFTVPPAPVQPAGITNQGGNHLHITPQIAINAGGSLPAASYVAADGLCIFGGQSTFAEMSTDVSTVGQSTVTADFWWACGGSTINYGKMFYSTNGGTTWTEINCPVTSTNQWRGQTIWTNTQVTDPAWAGQASLRFGFQFVTGTSSGSEADPGFAIDDFEIIGGNGGGSTSIGTSAFSPMSWCYGNTISEVLDFNATGTYNAGNVFSAELSDPTGSFAAPTIIGTLSSSSSGALSINVNIPGTVPTGSAYRIRVVSSNPITIGSDNGANIAVNAVPNVALSAFNSICDNAPAFSLSGGTPLGGIYSGTGVSGGMFDPAVAGVGTHVITYTFTDANTCSSFANASITVDDCSSVGELDTDAFAIFPNPATGSFSIAHGQVLESVVLLDANGRVVKAYPSVEGEFSLAGVEAGTYFVRIVSAHKTSTSALVVR